MEPVIIVHGGACLKSAMPSDDCLIVIGVKDAARAGYNVLQDGGDAVTAVELAVKALEDNPIYNAGFGSVLTKEGIVEMDAMIMRGDTMDAGAVGCVTNVKNPVSLARKVMEETSHAMMVGPAATQLARNLQLEMLPNDELISDKARARFNMRKEKEDSDNMMDKSTACDTVGAVALDRQGNLAVATSTGGLPYQSPGRVGDTPCIGSGGFCDEIGGVSTTGQGELIMRVCLARHATGLMHSGVTCQGAIEQALAYMKERVNGFGGMIGLSKDGDIAHSTTTEFMSWAAIKTGVLTYGLYPNDHTEEVINTK